MIQRVQQIKAFGVFADFQWPAGLPDFKQFNLIYGWNYSGKTTLSRAFRCFEQRQPHAAFPAAQIQLKAADGTIHHLHTPENAPLFRVFNSDFVHENISFDSASATPILVLGSADIAKQEVLKTKRTERQTLAADKDANEKARDEKTAGIQRALTKDARDLIKNPLAVPGYDKTRFGPKVEICRTSPGIYLLDDKAFAKCLAVFRSTDKKPTLSLKTPSLSSVTQAKDEAAELLARVVTANKPIPRLKENPAVESWVKEGRPLHEDKTACQFCGQPLPAGLLAHLAEHFSADYESLMVELNTLTEHLNAAENEEIILDSKADFYSELQERFAKERTRLHNALKARKAVLQTVAKAIASKRTKAFTSLECPAIDDPNEELASAIGAINTTISEHNSRTAEFDQKRDEAFTKLEMHYAAAFVHEQKYNETLEAIAGLRVTIADQTKTLAELDSQIRELEAELSEASKGAERINELLGAYFGKNDLRVEVSPENAFQIVRAGVIATNLSEGEKTAIAFAYFITRVRDGQHRLEDTRIVIDDPISSLDANHLFNTYALIKTQLAGSRQLFIATHSFEFYNLIREWVSDDEDTKKLQVNWKKWSVFYVKRTDNGQAVLEEIPKELLRFNSEYHYLFSTLYH
ncbi:MAG: AAA family ATPase, partial [Candidatus Acidiferrales bacterium]